jgi:hypothetical protein
VSSNPPPSPGIGGRFEEAVERIEFELQQAIAYVNNAVVPQVRAESIAAMRKAADALKNLADRIDRADQQRKGPQG